MNKSWLSWSTGKDSAWALKVLRDSGEYDIHGLLCTVNQHFDRVAMHAVRSDLLQRQAQALELELMLVDLPWPCSNDQYEMAMHTALDALERRGVKFLAFGDLHLQDVRRYREKLMQSSSIEPIFPLWGQSTRELARQMVDQGLRAVLTCVDPGQLQPHFAGRHFDADLLEELPVSVDHCGENGEFHTFVYDGPMFDRPLKVKVGERVVRDGFHFVDVLPD